MGLAKLKKQKGKYAAVETPRTPDMYAPQVFHGTSTEVTVPESSTARLSTWGASPRRANSVRNVRAGSTTATYWSPAITFRPIPLLLTAATSDPRRLVRDTIGSSRRWRKPACSMTAANDRAPSTSQIVVSRLAIPPRVKRSSMGATPELLTNPVAIALKMASIEVATGPRDGSSTNALTASHWVNGARMPAKSADPRMDRKGGYLRIAKTTSSSSGSRLTKPMLKAVASAARAASV